MHLKRIDIYGLGLYQHAHWEIQPGLNIIIGESGSGKSMLYQLIHFGLGYSSIDKTLIREDVVSAYVSLYFECTTQTVLQDIPVENNAVLIKRSIDHAGRSKLTCNGHVITLQQLKHIASRGLFLSKQHAHLELFQSPYLLQLLDRFIDPVIHAAYQEAYDMWHGFKETHADHHRDILSPEEVERIEKNIEPLHKLFADLQGENYTSIDQKARDIEYAITRQGILARFTDTLASTDIEKSALNCYTYLDEHKRSIVDSLIDIMHTLKIELGDSHHDFEQLLSEQATYDDLLQSMHTFAKRFHTTPDNLTTIYNALQLTLDKHHAAVVMAKDYAQKLENYHNICLQKAQELTTARTHAAQKLCSQINTHLPRLGIFNTPLTLILQEHKLTPTGHDQAELCLDSEGQDTLQPVKGRLSGGETSRLYLLIHSLLPNNVCYLFDEVDTGISGKTAMMVGLYLHRLSRDVPVVVISHTPQVAAFADHLWQLKKTHSPPIHTQIEQLDKLQHAQGISCILEGGNSQESALLHAHNLITQADILHNTPLE